MSRLRSLMWVLPACGLDSSHLQPARALVERRRSSERARRLEEAEEDAARKAAKEEREGAARILRGKAVVTPSRQVT
jgi:hypothetical protein